MFSGHPILCVGKVHFLESENAESCCLCHCSVYELPLIPIAISIMKGPIHLFSMYYRLIMLKQDDSRALTPLEVPIVEADGEPLCSLSNFVVISSGYFLSIFMDSSMSRLYPPHYAQVSSFLAQLSTGSSMNYQSIHLIWIIDTCPTRKHFSSQSSYISFLWWSLATFKSNDINVWLPKKVVIHRWF